MELLALVGLALLVFLAATPIAAFSSYARSRRLADELERLRAEVALLAKRVRELSSEKGAPGDTLADEGGARAGPAASRSGRAEAPRPAALTASTPTASAPSPSSDSPAPAADEPAADEPSGPSAPAVADAEARPGPEPSPAPEAEDLRQRAPIAAPEPERSAGDAEEGPTEERAAARSAIDLETLVGSTWGLRVGLGVLAIAFALFARTFVPQLPAWGKVVLAYAVAMALFGTGKVFERSLDRFAKPVMAAGLTFGFFVAFAAHFVPAMSAVALPVSIAWMVASMGTVLAAAERWESEVTAALAIVLGHVSVFVAAGSADAYSLVMIAFLAATAGALVLRRGWVGVGLFAVVASYGSHLLWLLADTDPLSGDLGFWINLAFLSSYYAVFVITDVLWWRRDAAGHGDRLPESRVRTARQTGPANLVLYASLTSFVFFSTGAELATIEWFYLTLGTLQGALAWLYWSLSHRDYVFYPAFGTVLWTLGFFAALDALALNLVLSAQALLLLLAAHHTRLLVFHGLAQLALLVAFVHYLAAPGATPAGLGFLLGGLGIAGVYLVKASLEEVWYDEVEGEEWVGSAAAADEDPSFEAALSGLLRPLTPYLASFHAALGGAVLVRELVRNLGWERETGLALVIGLAALGGVVLFRRRGALLFAFTAAAFGGPVFATRTEDPWVTIPLLLGLAAAGLVLLHLGDASRTAKLRERIAGHVQVVAVLALIGIAMALRPLDLGLAEYLAASSVPLVVLILLERLVSGGYAAEGEPRSDPGSVESRASFATSVGVSFVIFGLTVAGVGAVATTPVWIAGWSVLLGLVSIARRSRQLFACAYALLCVGYLGTLGWPTWPETMATPWTGLVATAVPLAFALGMDRAMRSHARLDEQLPRVAEPLTYVVYAIGLFLVVRLAVEHLPGGWALVAPAALALALLSSAGRLGLAAATPAALALLSGLHVIAAVDLLAGPGPAGLLLPLLLLSAATLAGERIVGDEPSDERLAAAWSTVRSALVVLAAGTGMAAIYDSARLGIGWTTAGWSVLGVALMGAGFALRSARYRRVALFVLGASLLRVFFVDTRGLSDTGRTVAFFVLGVCLVGVAWLYNRFSDELKSWL